MGGEVLTVLINEAVNAKINSLGRYIAVFHLCQTINIKQWYIVIYIWSKDCRVAFWVGTEKLALQPATNKDH